MKRLEKKNNKHLLEASGFRLEARHLKFLLFSVLLVASSLWLVACGYTTRSMISSRFKTICIKPFVNKIDITQEVNSGTRYKVYRPMLETDITQSVINKFLSDGNLKPAEAESADLILKSELIEFRRDPLRYTDANEIEEYRLNLVVNLSLWDRKEDKLVWEENGFTGDTTYFTTGVLAKSENTAIKDAISDLSRRIVERVVEEW